MPITAGDAVIKIIGDTKDLDRSMAGLKDRVKKGMQAVSKQLRVVGAGFTAVGVASLKLIGDARKLNAQFATTALGLKSTAKEVRELALETTNVTFPLRSVAATFDLLTRAGVKDRQMLKDSATAFDTLGDAVGQPAEAIADLLLPAFKLFGEAIPTTAAELDPFTFLVRTTTVDLQDFGTMLTRMAPEMDTLDLSMNDAVLTLAALSEKGIEGSAATLALRTAITKAAKEGVTLNEVMGISEETIARLTSKMKDATGITQEYADAANTQFGVMDKLKQKWSEITLRAGSFLQPMESVLTGVSALGPIMMALSTSVGASTVAWIANTVASIGHKIAMVAATVVTQAVTVAQWAWNAALLANPIGLIIIAIVALVAAGVALWKNWNKVTEFMGRAWTSIKQMFLNGVLKVLDALSTFTKFIPGLNKVVDRAREKIANMIDSEAVAKDAARVEESMEDLGDESEELRESVEALTPPVRVLTTSFQGLGTSVQNVADNAFVNLIERQKELGSEIGQFTINEAADLTVKMREAGFAAFTLDDAFDTLAKRGLQNLEDGARAAIEEILGLGDAAEETLVKVERVASALDIAKAEQAGRIIESISGPPKPNGRWGIRKRTEAERTAGMTAIELEERENVFRQARTAQAARLQVAREAGISLVAMESIRQFQQGIQAIFGGDTPSFGLPELAKGVRNFTGGLAIVGERGAELVNLPSGSDVTPIGGGLVVNVDMSNAVIYGEMDFEQRVMTAIRDNNLGGGVAP